MLFDEMKRITLGNSIFQSQQRLETADPLSSIVYDARTQPFAFPTDFVDLD